METIELLKTLSEAFGVSGFEDPIRETIEPLIEPYVDEIRTDKLGNLITTKKGAVGEETLMLDAHMDEIGLMINHIDEDGFLGFTNLGGWDQRILPAHEVTLITEEREEVTGVIGTEPPHIQKKEDRDKVIQMEDMFIDVGATSKEDVRDMGIGIGSFATIAYPFKQVDSNYVVGKAFDDRVGCACLIKVLENLSKETLDFDLVANFAICEETGLRGAKTAAYQIQPNLALAVEGTLGADIPGVPQKRQPVALGEGPAITVADRSIVVKSEIVRFIEKQARENGVPFQFKKPTYGGTDAGSIHTSRSGVKAAVLSVPCRYIHSPRSTMRLDDFDHTVTLVTRFIEGCGEIIYPN